MKVYKVQYKDEDNYTNVILVASNNEKEAIYTAGKNDYNCHSYDLKIELLDGLYCYFNTPKIIDNSDY